MISFKYSEIRDGRNSKQVIYCSENQENLTYVKIFHATYRFILFEKRPSKYLLKPTKKNGGRKYSSISKRLF